MKLLTKRILAFMLDYLVILAYAGVLFFISITISPVEELKSTLPYNPILGQLIGFLSLTLPVCLYSIISEKSNWQATIGKKILKLKVQINNQSRLIPILKRNILKYLPWEIAHTGIHWMFYYNSKGTEIPIWVWVLLILPQIVVFLYFITLFHKSGTQVLYDSIAETKVVKGHLIVS